MDFDAAGARQTSYLVTVGLPRKLNVFRNRFASRAFDTIRRYKLLTVLETFGNDSELRIILMLLVDTTLEQILKRGKGSTFATTVGTPQGDSLSPVLFVIYMEAAFAI